MQAWHPVISYYRGKTNDFVTSSKHGITSGNHPNASQTAKHVAKATDIVDESTGFVSSFVTRIEL